MSGWSPGGDEFSLLLEANPLTEFVELPSDMPHPNLRYSQILCGALRGALEMVCPPPLLFCLSGQGEGEQVHLEVEARFVQDALQGDPTTEIRVKFLRKLEDSVPLGDDD